MIEVKQVGFARDLAPLLKETGHSFPVTALLGPRQSGKTTLLKEVFPQFQYISLEDPDVLEALQEDTKGVLLKHKHWVIDEAQHFPELFSYIQTMVDNDEEKRFILSSSQNILLADKISQSLAGRVAILELLPLTINEFQTHKILPESVWEYLYHGSYPRPYQQQLNINLWFNSYIRTYLERDVRRIINIKDLSVFQRFLKLCAGRHGQLLSLQSLANDAGISQPTADSWLSMLEASFLVYRLKPYYKNYNKRIVKTPKLYFYDSAIVCRLLSIDSSEHLSNHAARGEIFEGFIISEIIKQYCNRGEQAPIYFWRDHTGMEVDVVLEKPQGLSALEIKSGATFSSDHLSNMNKFAKISGINKDDCHLVYTGENRFDQNGIQVLPWHEYLLL